MDPTGSISLEEFSDCMMPIGGKDGISSKTVSKAVCQNWAGILFLLKVNSRKMRE